MLINDSDNNGHDDDDDDDRMCKPGGGERITDKSRRRHTGQPRDRQLSGVQRKGVQEWRIVSAGSH